jgi:hypothetical protein
MNRREGSRNAVIIAALFATACAAGTRLNFNIVASDCGRTAAECANYCTQKPDRIACDVATVLAAEEVVEKNGAGFTAGQVQSSLSDMDAFCKGDGITRACKAAEGLRPIAMEAKQQGDGAAQASLRLQSAHDRAIAALKALRADRGLQIPCGPSGPCADPVFREAATSASRVEEEMSAASGLIRSRSDMKTVLEHVVAAEKAADDVDAVVARFRSETDAAQQERQARKNEQQAKEADAAARRAALRRAEQACDVQGGPPQACLKECEADATSMTCLVLGAIYQGTDNVAASPAKAATFFKRSCDAGVDVACKAGSDLNAEVAAKKKAEQDIPRLMAKCAAIAGRVRVMKAQVQAAVRARDRQRIAELQASNSNLGTEHTEAIRELESAINTATGGSGDRAAQLMMQGRKTCTP